MPDSGFGIKSGLDIALGELEDFLYYPASMRRKFIDFESDYLNPYLIDQTINATTNTKAFIEITPNN